MLVKDGIGNKMAAKGPYELWSKVYFTT